MGQEIRIGERAVEIAVGRLENGVAEVVVDGEAQQLGVKAVAPHHALVTWGGRARNVFAVRTAEGTWVWSEGRARLVADTPDRRRAGGGGIGPAVTPPMPAVVVKVLVVPGQRVAKNEPLVMVSAMKMETSLVAPYGGVVTAVNTEEGAKVNPGDILVSRHRRHVFLHGDQCGCRRQ